MKSCIFHPTLPNSKDDKTAANCVIAFLNGLQSRKSNNIKPMQQPDLDRFCFSQWANSFYIKSKKEQTN